MKEDEKQLSDSIDWQQVKQRLQEAERWQESDIQIDGDRMETILQERAAMLARRNLSAEPATASGGVVYLTFRLGEDRYAIELSPLAEIIPMRQCTSVPGCSGETLGVINFRNELRAVLDLAVLLDQPSREEKSDGAVLLLRDEGLQAGLRVDDVEEIVSLGDGAVRNDSSAVSTEGSDPYAHGITDEGIVVLDYLKLLAHPVFRAAEPNTASCERNPQDLPTR